MKAYSVTVAAALLLSLPAFADDDAARTRQSTTIHEDSTLHRSEQGERNANDPSSPNRAFGRERAEERHEMHERRDMRGSGATRGEDEHRTIRREHEGAMDRDRDDSVKHRMEMERHESSER